MEYSNDNEPACAADDLLARNLGRFGTILADPPWRFMNRTGKMAPEHKHLNRYSTMAHQEILDLPVAQLALPQSHLYLWVPNALVLEGLEVMKRWGYTYKTNLVWYKVRQDGGPDGRGVGFYFRNVTEMVLFGVRGGLRTLAPGRRQVNLISTRNASTRASPTNLSHRRIMQPWPVSRTLRTPSPRRVDLLGQRGRRRATHSKRRGARRATDSVRAAAQLSHETQDQLTPSKAQRLTTGEKPFPPVFLYPK